MASVFGKQRGFRRQRPRDEAGAEGKSCGVEDDDEEEKRDGWNVRGETEHSLGCGCYFVTVSGGSVSRDLENAR